MIKLQGLHKYFNKGRQNEIHVINDVSLELPEKGMVAIFGKSGCGKTTLLNVIGGLDSFASGSLTIEGQDVRRNTDVIRNRYIGYIFQNYNLNKSETCFENVADALRLCGMTDADGIEERVMAALSNVGMDKYRSRTPDTLSGGQQQRIAIARAIVKNPRIILADEPTGNLDEANTVMIMDLLKQIARDHLVLLVTHEANLVDYYCDTVVELSDGCVVSVKNNTAANGFAARDKNDVYLGELERSALQSPNAEIEYFGDAPASPIKLKIVNSGGKLYVEINTPGVQVLDEFSEVKLREGVFEQKTDRNTLSEGIDMSKLPPVEGTRFGRLFSLKSSIKSGYVSNFKNRKKGKKVLRGCMCLFAAVLVFMSAVFGTSFADIINARASYNHNVFYVWTGDAATSQKLNAAVGNADTGIDYVRLQYSANNRDSTVKFMTGFFETFSSLPYDEGFRTNAVYLDVSLAKGLPLVAGKNEGLAGEEILITTAVADALLEKSSLGYISERKDLIGLITNSMSNGGKNFRIAGVVESDEPAIYLTELAMAQLVMLDSDSYVSTSDALGIEVAPGEAVLVIRNVRGDNTEYPRVGETVKIHGHDIKVASILRQYSDYESWMQGNQIKKNGFDNYVEDLLGERYPELVSGTAEYQQKFDTLYEETYYDYLDYYYADLDQFLRDYYFFEPSMLELWMAVEKGVEEIKYLYTGVEYYKAHAYKAQYGRYPKQTEMNRYEPSVDLDVRIKELTLRYEDEFYRSQKYPYSRFYSNLYLVHESDLIAFSKQLGETHPTASSHYKYKKDNVVKEDTEIAYQSSVSVDVEMSIAYAPSNIVYTVVHSSNPEKTKQWLAREFGDLETGDEYIAPLVMPGDIFDLMIEERSTEIVAGLIAMAVILAVMSLCMYFIMRSSLMNRIKEVGIYRAIGVSKKNLIFRFFVEAVVLTTLTVLIGFALTSAFLFLCMGASPLVATTFFYPPWFAGILLAILYALCLLCGTLPILSLLRKTPSAILAKYDI